MNHDAVKTVSGQDRAWSLLTGLDPHDVCKRATVSFDVASCLYTMQSLGTHYNIVPKKRKIWSDSTWADSLLGEPRYFFALSIIWYLIHAKDIPLAGRLVKPLHTRGGQIFAAGTHILPLDAVAEKYANDSKGFIKRGLEFGAEVGSYGDASFKISPFPRVPVTIILWTADEEFHARAELMFDSTCDIQLPTDVIWSIATMSTLLLL
ncbi:MAG: DUF3786 domain-containing protein [Dissulfurispiraceae bacterium]